MKHLSVAAVLAAHLVSAPLTALAQAPVHQYEMSEQDLSAALKQFSAASGREVVASSAIVEGKRSRAVNGLLSPEEAMAQLLAGTDLSFELVDSAFVIRPFLGADAGDASASEIVVTGTRIRGAPVASPKITITAESMRDEGLATIADAVRAIPQNFGGGQNPGIGINVPTAAGVNVGSGSSLNLRGLGSDATLTLLNGRRLSYSSSRQSVDLSAIPAGAVDRIEIVADGASAIYGSDAVAGVANIILRKDAEGLLTSTRVGGSTDGGNFEQIYGVTTGARWRTGGSIIAYEFGRTTAIRAEDRSYARTRSPGLDLFPEIERHNVAASLHQAVGRRLTLSLDGLYHRRRSRNAYPLNAAGDLSVSRGETPSASESFLIAPALSAAIGAGWRIELSGSYGEDRVHYESNIFAGERLTSSASGCYCNDVRSVELSGDGPLFELPGGAARVALGAGYRSNGFSSFRGVGNPQNVEARQRSHYLYGEASLPLVGPDQQIGWIHALDASAALRYERYPGLASIVTPKLGLLYSPAAGFELKASWGRSFRAPTLFQRYQPLVVGVFPAAIFGGRGLPAGSTVLYRVGGRETLRPERARSWSATAVVRSVAIDGARFELSYFETRYRDRIVTPVGFLAQALSNPIYDEQIFREPASDFLEQVVAEARQFLNATGSPYDPATVVAVVDNANLNAGRQRLHGVDALLSYTRDLGGDAGTLSTTLNASYLESDQQLSPSQPVVDLAGTLFSPPHFRARATTGWSRGGLTLTAAFSHIGGVEDPRTTPATEVNGMNIVDLTLRYQTGEARGLLSHLDIVLTAQNLLNAKPDPIATTLPYDTPYDSTNYSPVGRFIALGISKKW